MTNEQITQNVIELLAYKAKAEEEHKMFDTMLKGIQENMDVFTKLAEDVHIMAINMTNMQKTLDSTVKKVEKVETAEFNRYKEDKKTARNVVISSVIGTIVGGIIAVIVAVITTYLKGGF